MGFIVVISIITIVTFSVIVVVTPFTISIYLVYLKFITWGFFCTGFVDVSCGMIIWQFQLETVSYL